MNPRGKLPIYSESGQTIVEYILILVVTVGIILGVVLQFNKAFETFANNYFGNYLSCLLETGELPSLGLNGSDNVGICNQEFQPFSFSAGRPPVSESRLKRTSPRTGSSQGHSEGKFSSSKNRLRYRGGRGQGRGSRGFGRQTSFRNKSSSDGFSSAPDKEGDGTEGGGVLNVGSIKGANKRSGSDDSGYGEGRAVKFRMKSGINKKKEEEGEIKSKASVNENQDGGRIAPIPIKKPQKKVAEVELELFNWMDYLRFIIIAGILIALFMLLAGQAVQIGKSAE